MENKPVHPGKILIVISIIVGALAIGAFALGAKLHPYSGWLLPVIIGVILVFIACAALYAHFNMAYEYNLYNTDKEAYKRLMDEKQAKLDASLKEQQKAEEERLSKLPACPICGSKKNVKRISSANRAVSATAWGLGSAKIGKQYECTHCKHYF